ncbi:hypothetical protein KUCAC02_004673, partial [Chaenocephalus aceratus]
WHPIISGDDKTSQMLASPRFPPCSDTESELLWLGFHYWVECRRPDGERKEEKEIRSRQEAPTMNTITFPPGSISHRSYCCLQGLERNIKGNCDFEFLSEHYNLWSFPLPGEKPSPTCSHPQPSLMISQRHTQGLVAQRIVVGVSNSYKSFEALGSASPLTRKLPDTPKTNFCLLSLCTGRLPVKQCSTPAATQRQNVPTFTSSTRR